MTYLDTPLVIPVLAAVYLLVVRLLLTLAERAAKVARFHSESSQEAANS